VEKVMGDAEVLMRLSLVQLIHYFLEVAGEMLRDFSWTLFLFWGLSYVSLHHVLGENEAPYCVRQLLHELNSLGVRDLDAS